MTAHNFSRFHLNKLFWFVFLISIVAIFVRAQTLARIVALDKSQSIFKLKNI